jgi:transketolase C-terminal domain/subunit
MKKYFFDLLIEQMAQNPDIYFISAGLGWPRTDELKEKFPERYIQTEASEQTALDICVGLAYADKIPVVYTITPFYYRAFETIRTYINHENLHVVMIGAGRDEDYGEHDGYSHSASDVGRIFRTQDNVLQYYPNTPKQLEGSFKLAIMKSCPSFISVPR